MSEFKKDLLELILKYYPDYERIEISCKKPMDTFTAKIEVYILE